VQLHVFFPFFTFETYRLSADQLRIAPDGSAVNPQAFQQHIRRDSQIMAQLLQAGVYFSIFIL
jgi:hypothetical protein